MTPSYENLLNELFLDRSRYVKDEAARLAFKERVIGELMILSGRTEEEAYQFVRHLKETREYLWEEKS